VQPERWICTKIRSLALQSGGEAVAAAEMMWRAAALDALQGYIIGPLTAATQQEQLRLQELVAQLLAPTLDAIISQSNLQVAPIDHNSLINHIFPIDRVPRSITTRYPGQSCRRPINIKAARTHCRCHHVTQRPVGAPMVDFPGRI
jgi:hypothetical protein